MKKEVKLLKRKTSSASNMVKIERYAKAHKITITQAMSHFM